MKTHSTSRPLYGGWFSYREWAEHGFLQSGGTLPIPVITLAGQVPARPRPVPPPRTATRAFPADTPGDPPVRAPQQPLDDQEPLDDIAAGRRAAQRLSQQTPGWFFLYGPASRRIWAFATHPEAPAKLMLDHSDPDTLLAHIRAAEAEHRLRPPGP